MKLFRYLDAASAELAVSCPVQAAKAHMIDWINDQKHWQPAVD
ncbi:hypothetical protein [Arthrobacter sp. FW305-BF8]|nr:hypothetical protein [Arthrobacter sp. FW305-BF8]